MNNEIVVPRLLYTTKITANFYTKLLAFIVLSLLSGLFFLSDDHRFGLAFLRELVVTLSILATLYMLIAKQQELDKTDWHLIILTIMLFLISPLFAYLIFHQPVTYGFLEERRVLLYFSYFLGMTLLINKRFSNDDLENIIKYLFYLAIIWSILNAYAIIPRNSGFSFSVHAEQFEEGFVSADARYATRFMEGWFLVSLYPYYLLARGQLIKAIIPIILLTIYMIFINQTRGLALMMVGTFAWILLLRLRHEKNNISFMALVPSIFILGYLAYFTYIYATNGQIFFYDAYRNRESQLFLKEIFENLFLPHGALSLQFNGGFFSIYGMNVYISDVGLIGLLYKYGFLFFPFIILMLTIILSLHKKYDNDFTIILVALFITECMTVPFGDMLGRGVEQFAVLMLLSRLQGDNNATKYIARIRRGWSSRSGYAVDEADAISG